MGGVMWAGFEDDSGDGHSDEGEGGDSDDVIDDYPGPQRTEDPRWGDLWALISYGFGGWEVQDQVAGRIGVCWEPTSWFIEGHLLAVSLHGRRGKRPLHLR